MSTESPILQLFNESGGEIPLTAEECESTLTLIARDENADFDFVELVFVDEPEIIRINKEHLGRDYVTDIITFRYDEGEETGENSAIEGTLFCCAPRIKEQAGEFDEPTVKEFMRIFIHGILHLTGYKDGTPKQKTAMTNLENKYLKLAGFNN